MKIRGHWICLPLFVISCVTLRATEEVRVPQTLPQTAGELPKRMTIVERSFGHKDVPLEKDLTVVTSEPLDPATVSARSVSLVRTDTGEAIPGDVTLAGKSLSFRVERKFHAKPKPGAKEAWWSGLKPNTHYELRLGESLRSRSGHALAPDARTLPFDTVEGDFGIYWLGADGSYEKAVAGVKSALFDPAKPVLLFLHGWENTTSEKDFFRENPFVFDNRYFGTRNLLPAVHKAGYNVAIFYWNQWSDEEEVQVAESKVWSGRSGYKDPEGKLAGMRFRLRDGTYRESADAKSAADMLLSEYKIAMNGFRGNHVRLVAHSLGSQLAVHFLKLLSDEVDGGRVPLMQFPRRLALLDPFWSRGPRTYLQGKWSGEVCREIMAPLLKKRDLAFEYIKTSFVGGYLVGDRNLDMRAMAAYYRVRPRFIPIWSQADLHWYAYVWYFSTWVDDAEKRTGESMGAAATDAEVKSRMNLSRAVKMTRFLKSGAETFETADDAVLVENGIDGI